MILVQSDNERKLPHHFDAASAMYGAIEMGENYRLTSFEEIQSGKLNNLLRLNTAVGSTDFMNEVFKQLGIEDVRLPSNSDRQCEFITLGEAQARVAAGEKLFVKPVSIKLFSGLVLDGMTHTSLAGVPENTQVMVYKPFEEKLKAEWRVYVRRNQIVDARNYSGDLFTVPDEKYLNEVIEKNKADFPTAYTIDIGIFGSPVIAPIVHKGWNILAGITNIVVEFNDMWAIGNYGMPNDTYLSMLKERYFEIVKR